MGFFVFLLFPEIAGGARIYDPVNIHLIISDYQLQWAILALVISHGFSFIYNVILGQEYRRTDPETLIFGPYRRVVVLHLTIILGAFASLAFRQSATSLVLLVVIKTILDARAHLRENSTSAVDRA